MGERKANSCRGLLSETFVKEELEEGMEGNAGEREEKSQIKQRPMRREIVAQK